jgi:hypothetical protein
MIGLLMASAAGLLWTIIVIVVIVALVLFVLRRI